MVSAQALRKTWSNTMNTLTSGYALEAPVKLSKNTCDTGDPA